jgi:broad specificity phosphatase PhoE
LVERVIFIRSGETDWNNSGRWQGWVASPLNEHGVRQAAALGRFVRHMGLSALHTSDLQRALQTAEQLAQYLDFAPTPDPRLRERDVGLWQGLTIAEMEAWYPEEFQQLRADRENFRVPGGESRGDVRLRMKTAFDDYIAQDVGETIAILSHTAAITVLIESVIPNEDLSHLQFSNTSATTIQRDGEGWKIVVANDANHLEGIKSDAVREPEDRR